MALSKNKYFSLVILFFITLHSHSQTKYVSDANYLQAKSESANNILGDYQIAYPDTGIKNTHNAIARNLLGNLGLPQPDYLFKYKSSPLGFNFYSVPFTADFFQPNQLEYYRTKGPYASLTGIAGAKEEQMLRLIFSHTLKNKLNITMKFNRYGSLGFYLKQQTFINNFFLSTNYTTTNKRFGFYAYFLLNKNKYQENGGIKTDIKQDTNITNTQLLAVNLNGAKREIGLMNGVFNPWMKLNKGSDSEIVSHFIDYKFNYVVNYYQYKDLNIYYDKYYLNSFLDTLKTNDSTHLQQFLNQINYTIKFNKTGLRASLGYQYEYNLMHQFYDSSFSNQHLNSTLYYNKFILSKDSGSINRNKYFSSKLCANSIFFGNNAGDYKIEWNSEFKFGVDANGLTTKKTNVFSINVLSEQRHPDFIYNRWYGNHFRWNNNYVPVNLFQANAGVKNLASGLSFSALYQTYDKYLYFDTLATPQQLNNNVSNWSFNLNFDKVLLNHFGIRANLYYQLTNNLNAIRNAPSAEQAALYYTGSLFKNNLQLQVGAQVELFQGFKPYDYMPATNIFYVQNKYKVGFYPFVDVFICARIRPVQFFLRVGNVLQGLTGSNYNYMAHYYQPDRNFQFGLTWLFFD